MTTKRAVYDVAEFKALPDDGEKKGRFEALVSVFGNVDLQGDRVVEGAFNKSLETWRASGAPIPVIWSHSWGDPNAHIGSADPKDVVEIKGKGLQVGGTIDLDNPFAAQVYRLLKERRVKEFSFGYGVVKERTAKDGANELLELSIIEVGPTLKGANPNTELLTVKSALEAAADTKMYGTLDGSVEQRQGLITDALRAAFGSDDVWVWTIATYPDRVVYEVSGPNGPAEHFEATYAIEGEVVTLGDPTPVEITSTVREKSLKAGRSISSKNEARIRNAVDSLTEVLASLGDADEKAPTPDTDEAKADADEPKAIDRDLLALKALIAKG